MYQVRIPALGASALDAEVTNIYVKPGDTVNPGDPIAQIDTDKVTVDLPAERSGIVTKVFVSIGDQCPTGTVVCEINITDLPSSL